MKKGLLWEAFGWGFLLWLFGYVLGFILFFVVPVPLIGWVIMPIAVTITLWVLMRIVKSTRIQHYLILAVVWTAIAIVFDYLFIVKMLNPADGYYKLDVYFYYILTFGLPLVAGWWKSQ